LKKLLAATIAQSISVHSLTRVRNSLRRALFSSVLADVRMWIRFLQKETGWQVAPWLAVTEGAGRGFLFLWHLWMKQRKWWAQ